MDVADVGASAIEVVVDSDAVRAGASVRVVLDRGARAVGFVGDEVADAEAVSAFVADVVRPA